MNIVKRLSDLPPEVLAAIGLFMHRRRWDANPIVIPEAINTIRVAFPRFQMVKRDLSEAIATAAAARGLSVYFDAPQPAAAGAEAERWADDGGR